MSADHPSHYAVLIDADNVSANFAKPMFEEVASIGEASIRRIYGDFSGTAPQGWTKETLAELAIQPYQQFANTRQKNASDIALVIDAMDILHSGRFDGFVLVTSDSDFTRLASRIREQGLNVIGMGERKTPASFVAACKRFVYLENLLDEPADDAESAKPTKDKAPVSRPPRKVPPSKAVPLILRALRSIRSDSEWVGLGQLGQVLLSNTPEFDARNYEGTDKLSTLLEKSGHFEVRTGPSNGLLVREKPNGK